MRQYSSEPRTRKCVEGSGFLSFARKNKKQLSDTDQILRKLLPKKQFIKQVNFLEIKLQTQSKDHKIVNQEPVKEIIIAIEMKYLTD